MVVAGRHTRRRRPSGALLALLLTLAVLVTVLGARAFSGGDDARLAYLDEVRPAVERSTQQGLELMALRAQVADLDRAALNRRLDRLARDARDTLDEVAGEAPPVALRPAHGLLVATLTVRSRGASMARAAFRQALGDEPPAQVAHTLAGVGSDLALADRTYDLLVQTLPAEDRAAIPESRWVRDATLWEEGELGALVSSLRSRTALAPVRDVAVVIVILDPAAVSREGAVDILPVASAIRLQVVVANVGNAEEKDVVVSARVAPASNAGVDTVEVDLRPGERRTVALGRAGRLRPVAGQQVTLTVSVGPVDGERNVADNQRTTIFLMR